jgi:hypothetical protein
MKNLMIATAVLTVALVAATTARAHEGHAHKVMGTVAGVQGNNLTVKTADGKSVVVMIDAKTKITRGTSKLDAASLKVGDRVVAEGAEEKTMIMAATVKVGTVAIAAKK